MIKKNKIINKINQIGIIFFYIEEKQIYVQHHKTKETRYQDSQFVVTVPLLKINNYSIINHYKIWRQMRVHIVCLKKFLLLLVRFTY